MATFITADLPIIHMPVLYLVEGERLYTCLGPFSLGSSSGADLRVDSPHVADRHLRFYHDEGWCVRPFENPAPPIQPATLNGQPLRSSSFLHPGDTLTLGLNTVLEVPRRGYLVPTEYRSDDVCRLMISIATEGRWEELAVVADALEDAGCTDAKVLALLRNNTVIAGD